MRNRFDRQLADLNKELTDLGMLVEEAIAGAVNVVMKHDLNTAKDIIMEDEEIDQKEREIEALCMKMFVQQQPVARDFRKITSALKLITDMERIGDQAADMCDIVLKTDIRPENIPEEIKTMAAGAIYMVNTAIEAYIENNEALAREVIAYDERIDSLFVEVKHILTEAIKSNSDTNIDAIDVLMIAKYIEKIGDHAENIAGWVVYSITGVHADSM